MKIPQNGEVKILVLVSIFINAGKTYAEFELVKLY
jgi:hypothetical protein